MKIQQHNNSIESKSNYISQVVNKILSQMQKQQIYNIHNKIRLIYMALYTLELYSVFFVLFSFSHVQSISSNVKFAP